MHILMYMIIEYGKNIQSKSNPCGNHIRMKYFPMHFKWNDYDFNWMLAFRPLHYFPVPFDLNYNRIDRKTNTNE